MNILIVDDVATNRKLLRVNLEAEGFTAFEAANGREALDLLERERIDVVVSDILMPVMDGLQFCMAVRKHERLSTTPFIICTSTLDSAAERDLVMSAGADRFINKPVSMKLLLQHISELTEKAHHKPVRPPSRLDELDMAKEYSSALARKLEEKVADLELSRVRLEQANEELKHQKADLEQSAECLREQAALIDFDPDAIVVLDLENRIQFWNKGAERLYSWTADEVRSKTAFEVFYKEVPQQATEAWKAVRERGGWEGELRHLTRDQRQVTVASHWILLRDEQGRPKSILSISTDITEKKQLEAQFLRVQRMENIGALAGGVAHDLNNVLAPILMSIQLLRMKMPGPEVEKLLNIVESSAKRGTGMVQQILSFARGTDGEKKAVQVKHLIDDIRNMARDTFPAGIQFHTDLPKDLWMVNADATQLYQVLLNLCVNARDAMPNGGRLTVQAENLVLDESYARMEPGAKAGPYIVLTVTDSGTGMPPEVLKKIFDPFFTTKKAGKGTGLGLSTVLSITKNHNGFVKVHSEVGKGTQFKVQLPATRSAEPEQLKPPTSQLPLGQGELVLVIDDEASIREITKVTLEAHNYRVATANDGTEALGVFVQHGMEIQLVVTDLEMPFMDGAATIRALRKLNPQVRIIAVSGSTAHRDKGLQDELPVQAFITKPYTAEQLLRQVHEVLEAGPAVTKQEAA